MKPINNPSTFGSQNASCEGQSSTKFLQPQTQERNGFSILSEMGSFAFSSPARGLGTGVFPNDSCKAHFPDMFETKSRFTTNMPHPRGGHIALSLSKLGTATFDLHLAKYHQFLCSHQAKSSRTALRELQAYRRRVFRTSVG